jgi:hypothetical protein
VSYDPLSSRGISKALESALRTGPAVADWFHGRKHALADYAAWVEADFQNYRRHYRHFYGQVRRWPESRFWQRRTDDPLLAQSEN